MGYPWRSPADLEVALRKESVDRNTGSKHYVSATATSLSARRAWIEMLPFMILPPLQNVALRKESVDRNEDRKKIEAWHLVALRKESVDRNQ